MLRDGSLWVAHRWPLVVYWGDCYWGGQIALLGGALLVGGVARADRRGARLGDGLAVGVGLALLAVSRPAEGLLFAALVFGWLAWRLLSRGRRDGGALRLGLVAAGVVLPTLGWMAYYDYRVTGDAATPPYVEHNRQYAVAPSFVYQPLSPVPTYHSATHREQQAEWEVANWRRQQTAAGHARSVAGRLTDLARDTVLRGLMFVPLGVALLAWRRSGRVRAAATGLFVFVGTVAWTETWTMSHYVAPAGGLLALLVVAGLRRLRAWGRRGRPAGGWGRVAARLVVLALLAVSLRGALGLARSSGWNDARAALVRRLEAGGGNHLLVVRNGPGHLLVHEWVANRADPPTQRVVFANEVDGPLLGELLAAYGAGEGRSVWLLEPDVDGSRVVPYPPPAAVTTVP